MPIFGISVDVYPVQGRGAARVVDAASVSRGWRFWVLVAAIVAFRLSYCFAVRARARYNRLFTHRHGRKRWRREFIQFVTASMKVHLDHMRHKKESALQTQVGRLTFSTVKPMALAILPPTNSFLLQEEFMSGDETYHIVKAINNEAGPPLIRPRYVVHERFL